MTTILASGVAIDRKMATLQPRTCAREWHFVAAAAAFSAAALLHGAQVDRRTIVIAAVIGLVIVGLPHGQFDWRAARVRLSPLLGRRWPLLFVSAYLGLAAVVALLWVLAPVAGLVVFLACSVLHFGIEDLQAGAGSAHLPRALVLAVRGTAPFLLPAAMHTTLTAWWVAKATGTTPGAVYAVLVTALPWVWPMWAGGAAILSAAYVLSRCWCLVAEWAAACAAMALLPPVTGFLLWFLVAHAPRHVIQVVLDAEVRREARGWLFRELGWGALASTAVLALLAVLATRAPFLALQVAVAGLAAITAPHLLVCTLLSRPHAIAP